MANNGQSNEALGYDFLELQSTPDNYSKKLESEQNKDLILEKTLDRLKFSDILFQKRKETT